MILKTPGSKILKIHTEPKGGIPNDKIWQPVACKKRLSVGKSASCPNL